MDGAIVTALTRVAAIASLSTKREAMLLPRPSSAYVAIGAGLGYAYAGTRLQPQLVHVLYQPKGPRSTQALR